MSETVIVTIALGLGLAIFGVASLLVIKRSGKEEERKNREVVRVYHLYCSDEEKANTLFKKLEATSMNIDGPIEDIKGLFHLFVTTHQVIEVEKAIGLGIIERGKLISEEGTFK